MENKVNIYTLGSHGRKICTSNLSQLSTINNVDISDTNYYFLSITESGTPLKKAVGVLFQYALESEEFNKSLADAIRPIVNKRISREFPICANEKTLIKDFVCYGMLVLLLISN